MVGTSNIIKVKGRIIGGEAVQVCVPIVANSSVDVMKEAEYIYETGPDLVEWRADYFENIYNDRDLLTTLENLRKRLHQTPIIFTLRSPLEGGAQAIDSKSRVEIIKKVIYSGYADFIDVELMNCENIHEIIELSRERGIYTIVSNHDFNKTPPQNVIIERLKKAEQLNADIAKIAVMPKVDKDVIDLLKATRLAKIHMDIPIIAISMSKRGLISRIIGGIYGSSITFASGRNESAPGQIPILEIRRALKTLGEYDYTVM